MTFYEALEIAMKEKGMRAVDVCRKAGLYTSYLAKLKNGTFTDVTWSKAIRIIDALDMTLEEFYALQKSDEQ